MNNKSRTLVNILGIPLIVGSIYLGGYLFTSLIAAIIILGTIEYNNLLKKKSATPSFTLLIIGQLLLIIGSYSFTYYSNLSQIPISNIKSHFVEYSDTLFWYFILFTIVSMVYEVFRKKNTPLLNISSNIFGFVWIGLFINSLVYVRLIAGAELTLVMFFSLWICDTFAFFFGKNFGKRKIMPEISPNKTVVGTISGLIGSIMFIMMLAHFSVINLSLISALILGLITGGISQFGDFFESLLKREVNIKDTSNILSGHGGILDRFDSLAIISPLLLLFVYIVR